MMKPKEGESLGWRYFGVAFTVVLFLILLFSYLSKNSQTQADQTLSDKEKIPKLRTSDPAKQISMGGGEEAESLTKKYALLENESPSPNLQISAESALIADLTSGKVLFAKEPHKRLFPASVTKIFTAIVAKEIYPENKEFVISKEAASQIPNIMGLKEGERLTTEELLLGLLINSGNDAALALAEADQNQLNGFVERMNKLAKKLGLKETHFTNPSGLHDPDHYSSAYDIAVGMRYLAAKYPDLIEIMGTKERLIPANNYHHTYFLRSLSTVLREIPEIVAVKTGYTPEAGHTWVAIVKRGEKGILISFLNSWQSTDDAKKLIKFAFNTK